MPTGDLNSAKVDPEAASAPAPQGPLERWVNWLLAQPRNRSLLTAAILVAAIAFTDWIVKSNVALGFLYFLPVLLASPHLNRTSVLLMAVVCSLLRESLAPFGWDPQVLTRLILVFTTYLGIGLFANEIGRNRRLTLSHLASLREQVELRIEAERQLYTLIESSPAAILTVDSRGSVELANQAAHSLLQVPAGQLRGCNIGDFLPVVADALSGAPHSYRTATSCRGCRMGGEPFLACVWFATYQTRSGLRLAAIVTDASDDLRDWQETSLQNLLRSTRVLVGTVSHEIRNVCAAIGMVHANLGRLPGVAASPDYEALGSLAAVLAKVATYEMSSAAEVPHAAVDIRSVLEELRIILEPQLAAGAIEYSLSLPAGLPLVEGDHHGLLQVLLNLTRNSLRALEHAPHRGLSVQAEITASDVLVRLHDTGPGIAFPDRLFRPFQPGAESAGLGLYIARAIIRSAGGELYHEPAESGCTMCIQLRQWSHNQEGGETT